MRASLHAPSRWVKEMQKGGAESPDQGSRLGAEVAIQAMNWRRWRRRHFPFNAEQSVSVFGEIGPLVVMFLVNGIWGIKAGSGALIVATVVSLAVSLRVLGRPPIMAFIAGGVSVAFGVLTWITGDPMWVPIKVTLFNTLVAATLWVGWKTGT